MFPSRSRRIVHLGDLEPGAGVISHVSGMNWFWRSSKLPLGLLHCQLPNKSWLQLVLLY
jgi:hypothetical protein